ncbi:G-type lectin S-receptor-like serine/threonine-protein kinase At2g19130 [Carya illinoinensis]|uniref:G-type lectin S-receptor-like serine/threonine-protein kinase At2g19130 n=1 Tax=Carya illinoinensis TaxID=32201 RepID=UPI001C7222C5|nr:G-type lectin S-receptor-like serine/threonine-protein kinase At2g19130 [Carya illinoinensis]
MTSYEVLLQPLTPIQLTLFPNPSFWRRWGVGVGARILPPLKMVNSSNNRARVSLNLVAISSAHVFPCAIPNQYTKLNISTKFWESFDHPTDTWLPGAKLGVDKAGKVLKQLISWTDLEDPSLGLFSFSLRLDPNGSSEYILEWNRSQVYWSSGVWDGNTFVFVPELKLNNVFNFSFVSNENETYFTYSRFDASLMSHFVINSTGQIQQLTWLSSVQPWGLFWAQPASLSNVYAFCGPFGIYDDNSSNIFDCPKGFELFSDTQTRLNVWSGGCLRKHPLQCGNLNGKGEWFLKIPNIKFPVNLKAYLAVSARRCNWLV